MNGQEDQARRDAWLEAKARDPYKHRVWVGRDVSIADAERWLREALEENERLREVAFQRFETTEEFAAWLEQIRLAKSAEDDEVERRLVEALEALPYEPPSSELLGPQPSESAEEYATRRDQIKQDALALLAAWEIELTPEELDELRAPRLGDVGPDRRPGRLKGEIEIKPGFEEIPDGFDFEEGSEDEMLDAGFEEYVTQILDRNRWETMQPLELSLYETLEQAHEAAEEHRQAMPEREFRVVRRLVHEEVVPDA